jgi:hypothetical protein
MLSRVRKAKSETEATEEAVRSLVDRSLIDEMLRLSPLERLRQNDRMAALAVNVRAAFVGTGDGRSP